MNKFCLIIAILIIMPCFAVEDEIANELPQDVPVPKIHADYDYQGTERVPVKIRIKTEIPSETEVYDGQTVEFELVKPIIYDREIVLRAGETIRADIQIVITPGMNGIPASIVFNNFRTDKSLHGSFSESMEIFGQDRSYWVFPLKWALTAIPPTGSLTNFIMGGHARLGNDKVLKIYYYPDWSSN